MAKKEVVYTIGAVAERYGVHPQTLRAWEREGLLKPSRSEGNTRLFTREDLARLEVILSLTRELGVNLAGVEVILHMRERMERMNREFDELIEYVQSRFAAGGGLQDPARTALTRVPVSQIIRSMRRRE